MSGFKVQIVLTLLAWTGLHIARLGCQRKDGHAQCTGNTAF